MVPEALVPPPRVLDWVRFAGRCDDGPFGLVVIDAADERAARELVQCDPSVRDGTQHAELHPFRTFVARERGPQER
jgi:hypothetical protein